MAATERHVRRRRDPAPARTRVVGDPVPGAVIDFRSVTKKYPSGDLGLQDATFSVVPGEFVFLVGSTGSGKSTIIRLLIKEIDPTYGAIHVAGRDLGSITRKRIPNYRRNLGVVFQDFKLLPNRTGTTVVVATHDNAMVDRMRRRVIEVSHGSIVRDERAGSYAGTESTREFAALMRDEVTEPRTERFRARRRADAAADLEPERDADA